MRVSGVALSRISASDTDLIVSQVNSTLRFRKSENKHFALLPATSKNQQLQKQNENPIKLISIVQTTFLFIYLNTFLCVVLFYMYVHLDIKKTFSIIFHVSLVM